MAYASEQTNGWSKWVIGTLGTLALMFMGFYFQSVSANFDESKTTNMAQTQAIAVQNERLAGLEAREKALFESLSQIQQDVRETRDAVLRASVRNSNNQPTPEPTSNGWIRR